jgi:uncharacterized membrane protein YoaK (UPF0700 family)
MFREEGKRSDRQHRMLAGYLAFVGGFVNSIGFVLIGTFTSHVTGNVGRAAHALASGEPLAGFTSFMMVAFFFFGAFVASVVVESSFFGRRSRAYAAALGIEATLLATFALWSRFLGSSNPRLQEVEALFLCVSMGMQNSLVTRLSGAVVRTTHLTGVMTDLGIEGARWFRHWRSVLGTKLHVPLVAGKNPAEHPQLPKTLLLLTIAGAFVCGTIAGSLLVRRYMHATVGFASAAVAVFAAYAAFSSEEGPARSRR